MASSLSADAAEFVPLTPSPTEETAGKSDTVVNNGPENGRNPGAQPQLQIREVPRFLTSCFPFVQMEGDIRSEANRFALPFQQYPGLSRTVPMPAPPPIRYPAWQNLRPDMFAGFPAAPGLPQQAFSSLPFAEPIAVSAPSLPDEVTTGNSLPTPLGIQVAGVPGAAGLILAAQPNGHLSTPWVVASAPPTQPPPPPHPPPIQQQQRQQQQQAKNPPSLGKPSHQHRQQQSEQSSQKSTQTMSSKSMGSSGVGASAPSKDRPPSPVLISRSAQTNLPKQIQNCTLQEKPHPCYAKNTTKALRPQSDCTHEQMEQKLEDQDSDSGYNSPLQSKKLVSCGTQIQRLNSPVLNHSIPKEINHTTTTNSFAAAVSKGVKTPVPSKIIIEKRDEEREQRSEEVGSDSRKRTKKKKDSRKSVKQMHATLGATSKLLSRSSSSVSSAGTKHGDDDEKIDLHSWTDFPPMVPGGSNLPGKPGIVAGQHSVANSNRESGKGSGSHSAEGSDSVPLTIERTAHAPPWSIKTMDAANTANISSNMESSGNNSGLGIITSDHIVDKNYGVVEEKSRKKKGGSSHQVAAGHQTESGKSGRGLKPGQGAELGRELSKLMSSTDVESVLAAAVHKPTVSNTTVTVVNSSPVVTVGSSTLSQPQTNVGSGTVSPATTSNSGPSPPITAHTPGYQPPTLYNTKTTVAWPVLSATANTAATGSSSISSIMPSYPSMNFSTPPPPPPHTMPPPPFLSVPPFTGLPLNIPPPPVHLPPPPLPPPSGNLCQPPSFTNTRPSHPQLSPRIPQGLPARPIRPLGNPGYPQQLNKAPPLTSNPVRPTNLKQPLHQQQQQQQQQQQDSRGKNQSAPSNSGQQRPYAHHVTSASNTPNKLAATPATLHATQKTSLPYSSVAANKPSETTNNTTEQSPKSESSPRGTAGSSEADEKKRRRRRRRHRRSSRPEEGREGSPLLEHGLSSSNVSESTLHFEDVDEFPDLLTAGGGASRGCLMGEDLVGGGERATLSGTSLSYSDVIKATWSKAGSQSRTQSLTGSCPSGEDEDNASNHTGTSNLSKRARKRRRRREQANKAAEAELAEISLEQQWLQRVSLRKSPATTSDLSGTRGIVTNPDAVGEAVSQVSSKAATPGGGGSGKKFQQPIAFDIAAMIDAIQKKPAPQPSNTVPVKVATGASSTKSVKKEGGSSSGTGNLLDSSAPLQKRGKEREVARTKKPSPLKKVILKEREQRKRLRLLDGDPDTMPDMTGSKGAGVGTIGGESELSQEALSSKSEGTDEAEVCATAELSNDLSPISQTSPISMSPASPGNSGVSSPSAGSLGRDPVIMKIHSRRFREYCTQILDKEIDQCCTSLLQELVRFQDRMYHKDPVKAKNKRRVVLGLREVTKHLKLKRIKCVVISPNLEKIQSKGGLDEALNTILNMCQEQNVPFVFALGRRALGRACAKLVPVSVVGIFNYEGCESKYQSLISLTAAAREAYHEMVLAVEREVAEQHPNSQASSLGGVPGLPRLSHMGHSRTPSGCSAISFTSSVLSEPISENFPHAEPEVDSKGYEIVRDAAGNVVHSQDGRANDFDDGNEADTEDLGESRRRKRLGRNQNSVRFGDERTNQRGDVQQPEEKISREEVVSSKDEEVEESGRALLQKEMGSSKEISGVKATLPPHIDSIHSGSYNIGEAILSQHMGLAAGQMSPSSLSAVCGSEGRRHRKDSGDKDNADNGNSDDDDDNIPAVDDDDEEDEEEEIDIVDNNDEVDDDDDDDNIGGDDEQEDGEDEGDDDGGDEAQDVQARSHHRIIDKERIKSWLESQTNVTPED